MPDDELDDNYLNDVSPDVLGVLEKLCFFDRLDKQFYSVRDAKVLLQCSGTHAVCIEILRDLKMDSDDIQDILSVLRSRGGCCDCEVLYNVATESNLRSEYWKGRARGETPRTPHSTEPGD